MRKFNQKVLFVLIVCFILVVPVTVYSGVGARPMGMGGAFVGVADDVNALYWNPAGLVQIDNFEATYSRTLSDGRDIMPLDDFTGVAHSIKDIEDDIDIAYGGSYLGFNGHRWYSLSLATRFQMVALGGNIRHVRESIDGNSENDFAGDIGAMVWINEQVKCGVLFQHLLRAELFNEKASRDIRPGVSYKVNDSLILAADIYAINKAERRDYHFGAEYDVAQIEPLTLRAGFYREALTCGIGLTPHENISIDFAYYYEDDEGDPAANIRIRQLGLTVRF